MPRRTFCVRGANRRGDRDDSGAAPAAPSLMDSSLRSEFKSCHSSARAHRSTVQVDTRSGTAAPDSMACLERSVRPSGSTLALARPRRIRWRVSSAPFDPPGRHSLWHGRAGFDGVSRALRSTFRVDTRSGTAAPDSMTCLERSVRPSGSTLALVRPRRIRSGGPDRTRTVAPERTRTSSAPFTPPGRHSLRRGHVDEIGGHASADSACCPARGVMTSSPRGSQPVWNANGVGAVSTLGDDLP